MIKLCPDCDRTYPESHATCPRCTGYHLQIYDGTWHNTTTIFPDKESAKEYYDRVIRDYPKSSFRIVQGNKTVYNYTPL